MSSKKNDKSKLLQKEKIHTAAGWRRSSSAEKSPKSAKGKSKKL